MYGPALRARMEFLLHRKHVSLVGPSEKNDSEPIPSRTSGLMLGLGFSFGVLCMTNSGVAQSAVKCRFLALYGCAFRARIYTCSVSLRARPLQ